MRFSFLGKHSLGEADWGHKMPFEKKQKIDTTKDGDPITEYMNLIKSTMLYETGAPIIDED